MRSNIVSHLHVHFRRLVLLTSTHKVPVAVHFEGRSIERDCINRIAVDFQFCCFRWQRCPFLFLACNIFRIVFFLKFAKVAKNASSPSWLILLFYFRLGDNFLVLVRSDERRYAPCCPPPPPPPPKRCCSCCSCSCCCCCCVAKKFGGGGTATTCFFLRVPSERRLQSSADPRRRGGGTSRIARRFDIPGRRAAGSAPQTPRPLRSRYVVRHLFFFFFFKSSSCIRLEPKVFFFDCLVSQRILSLFFGELFRVLGFKKERRQKGRENDVFFFRRNAQGVG